MLISAPIIAQSVDDPAELLRRVRSVAANTKSWRAEVVEKSTLSGGGMDLQGEVRTKIAVQAPLKVNRQNSGSDRTLIICDGVEMLYSGDGHSYYRSEARVEYQCDYPLSKFFQLDERPASVAVLGRDHVRLTDGDRECVLVHAEWKRDSGNVVRIMCIDPKAALILRDVIATEDEQTGIKAVTETTVVDFERDPTFPSSTFWISLPQGALESKPPI